MDELIKELKKLLDYRFVCNYQSSHNCICYDDVEELVEKYLAFKAKDKAVEPGINGHGVAVCPTCGATIKRCEGCPPVPSKAVETLAARLAFDKEWMYSVMSEGGFYWSITLRPKSMEQGYPVAFHGDTYAAAEAKARAYLEGLDDVKENK